MKKVTILLSLIFSFILVCGIVSAAYNSNLEVDSAVDIGSGSSVSVDVSANANTSSEKENRTNKNIADIVARINLRTGLNITAEEDESLGAILRVYLSNGKYALVKVLPETASLTAQERLKAKCEEENCTVELKEVRVNGEAKAVYEVKTAKTAKILGIFKAKMNVQANVDAETGEVVSVKKPWWASISSEVDESAKVG